MTEPVVNEKPENPRGRAGFPGRSMKLCLSALSWDHAGNAWLHVHDRESSAFLFYGTRDGNPFFQFNIPTGG